MFEFILMLALLPLALIGLLLLMGVLVFTWRFIAAGILFIMGAYFIADSDWDTVWKLITIYFGGALLWMWATAPLEHWLENDDEHSRHRTSKDG